MKLSDLEKEKICFSITVLIVKLKKELNNFEKIKMIYRPLTESEHVQETVIKKEIIFYKSLIQKIKNE